MPSKARQKRHCVTFLDLQSMYFTENRYDRSIESMMKGIPNFYPRGSGIVVTKKFEYTAKISPNTVKRHIRNIMEKTGYESRLELAMNAKSLGLVVSDKERTNDPKQRRLK